MGILSISVFSIQNLVVKIIRSIYNLASTAGAQVLEDSSADEKYWVTTPSSAINEYLLERTRIPPSMDNPNARESSAFPSERNMMPAAAPPEVLPQASITNASFVVMQMVSSTPLAFNSSCAVMKLGRCDFEQPGVYAPGTAKIATFLPLINSAILTLEGLP